MEKATASVERYIQPRKKHTEKGRDPINSREEILSKVAKATKTTIPRWCRYSEQELLRAYIRLQEAKNVKSKSGYLIWLLKNP